FLDHSDGNIQTESVKEGAVIGLKPAVRATAARHQEDRFDRFSQLAQDPEPCEGFAKEMAEMVIVLAAVDMTTGKLLFGLLAEPADLAFNQISATREAFMAKLAICIENASGVCPSLIAQRRDEM